MRNRSIAATAVASKPCAMRAATAPIIESEPALARNEIFASVKAPDPDRLFDQMVGRRRRQKRPAHDKQRKMQFRRFRHRDLAENDQRPMRQVQRIRDLADIDHGRSAHHPIHDRRFLSRPDDQRRTQTRNECRQARKPGPLAVEEHRRHQQGRAGNRQPLCRNRRQLSRSTAQAERRSSAQRPCCAADRRKLPDCGTIPIETAARTKDRARQAQAPAHAESTSPETPPSGERRYRTALQCRATTNEAAADRWRGARNTRSSHRNRRLPARAARPPRTSRNRPSPWAAAGRYTPHTIPTASRPMRGQDA